MAEKSKSNELIQEIKLELGFLNCTVSDINGLIEITKEKEATRYYIAAAAMLLSQFYNVIET